MNTQDWSPLGRTGWISLQSKGLSRVFSNTTVQKHPFFSAQLSLRPNSHIKTKKTLCAPGPGERSSDPTRDWPRAARECPGVSSRGVGGRWLLQGWGHCVGLGALSRAVRAGHLLKEVPLSPSPPPQFGLRSINREGTQPHPSTEVGLKIYWAWPRPSEQGPVSPIVGLSHQEASISLLSLPVRGRKEWKPQSQKTNQTDHTDHSLV